MSMREITVTDENGVDFHAITFDAQPEVDGHVTAWVFTDKPSGFGDDVGRLNMKSVKLLGNGSGQYGA